MVGVGLEEQGVARFQGLADPADGDGESPFEDGELFSVPGGCAGSPSGGDLRGGSAAVVRYADDLIALCRSRDQAQPAALWRSTARHDESRHVLTGAAAGNAPWPHRAIIPQPGEMHETSATAPASINGVPSRFDPSSLFSLNPRVAHLNHASFGAVSVPVQQAQEELRKQADMDPMRFFARSLPDRVASTRRQLAEFLGADPDGTVLIFNVSTGIAVVLHSLALGGGDEIVVTNHSHFAVDYAVDREQRRSGVRIRRVHIPLVTSDNELIAAITAAIKPGRTRLVVIPQIASATARLMPVSALAKALRSMEVPLLVDAAHAPGMLPSPASGVDADFWIGNMHKWAFAPRGTSVLVVAPQWRERVDPLVVSRRYTEGFPVSFDQPGAFDYTGWLAAPAGLEVLGSLGHEAVRQHNSELAAYGQQVVASVLQVGPADLPVLSSGVSMSLVPLPHGIAVTDQEIGMLRQRIFEELATEVAIHVWEGRAYLRLSAQIYNRAEEYERLAAGLPALIRALA